MPDLEFEDEHDQFDRALYNLAILGFVAKSFNETGEEVYEITETGSAYFQMMSEGFVLN